MGEEGMLELVYKLGRLELTHVSAAKAAAAR